MKFRPEYDPKVIGRNLRSLREKKNLSVNDVSKYMYLTKEYLTPILNFEPFLEKPPLYLKLPYPNTSIDTV